MLNEPIQPEQQRQQAEALRDRAEDNRHDAQRDRGVSEALRAYVGEAPVVSAEQRRRPRAPEAPEK